ncbi:polysaccharide pyruvyl transferase family protein [Streptomyces sp. NPDC048172]|uniref:polysaccharide pyruvyl transferase family protein n=1 Tax=Streptomyces sp. NPDC048172 TaxID=3365505 RepID=UPI0037154475
MHRVLLSGWFSFLHGEVTTGDVLALRRVQEVLHRAGVPYDTAWSPVFRPGALRLTDAAPEAYSHVVFLCGPLQGPEVEVLHRQFAGCVRIAVGTSVPDAGTPAAARFHSVLPREAPGTAPPLDLAALAPGTAPVPVVGLILGQGRHGQHGHGHGHGREAVHALTRWLGAQDCARLPLDTHLDSGDWRLCAHPGQVQSLLGRLDTVVTDRPHGLVLALRAGVPVLAVDPVAGGAAVTAQARACDWPAVVAADRVGFAECERWWSWCLEAGGRRLARERSAGLTPARTHDRAHELLSVLRAFGSGEDGHPALKDC